MTTATLTRPTPLTPSNHGYACDAAPHADVDEAWFYGTLSHDEAAALLAHNPSGVFLIRREGRQTMLTHVRRTGETVSSVLGRTGLRRRWTCVSPHWRAESNGARQSYASLRELVTEELIDRRGMWPLGNWRRQVLRKTYEARVHVAA